MGASVDTTRCRERELVIAHFEGGNAPGDERALRDHLGGCDACRSAYERELLLERLDPSRSAPKERIGRALGLRGSRGVGRWIVALAAAATVLLAVGVARQLGEHEARPAFQPRGEAAGRPAPTLSVYHGRAGEQLRAVKSALARGDELAFAYRNPGDQRYLLLFALDEQRNIYWFHPAWTDAKKNPSALAIEDGVRLHELPAAIRHDYRGDNLTVVAIFGPEPHRARSVEAKLRAAGFDVKRAFGSDEYDIISRRLSLRSPTPDP